MYKLTYIKVEGLPSLGPQEITLSLDHSVYFIMGANGTGKTTILNIINYCFEQKWDKLLEIQFEKITLSFEGENNKKFFLKKDGASLILSPDSNFVEENKLKIDLSSEHSKEQLISIALKFKKIKTLPCGHWSTTSSSKDDQNFIHMKSPEKVLEYLSGLEEILPDIQHFIGDDSIITDFANTLIQEDIFFISTNRMQKIPKYRNNNQQIWLKDLNRYITNKINVDIDEMSDDISGIYEKYNTIVRNNQLTLINELQSNVEGLDQNSLSETGNAEEIYQQYQESIKSFEKIGITLETTIKHQILTVHT